MAAKLSRSLEEQVTCPICLEQYQDPRILPCLHTYCRMCLEDLLDKRRKASMKCPECRKSCQVEDVSSLQVNIWVNKSLSLLELSKAENESRDAGLDGLQCGNCDRKEPATARCLDCEAFMCGTCIKAHQLMSVLKDHQLLTLEEIKTKGIPTVEKPTLCGKHQGKKQKLFCKDCEELICKDCTLIDHKDHEFAFIADVAEKYKAKLQKRIENACDMKEEFQSALNEVKCMQEKVRENAETIKEEIDEKINAKIAILEEKRAGLKQESTDLAARKVKRLSLVQKHFEKHLAGLTSAIEFTENILAKGSCSDVVLKLEPIKSRFEELFEERIDTSMEGSEEYVKLVLEVNEIPDGYMENYLVIEDPRHDSSDDSDLNSPENSDTDLAQHSEHDSASHSDPDVHLDQDSDASTDSEPDWAPNLNPRVHLFLRGDSDRSSESSTD